MEHQSTLLQIIQFVGLITPALAILIELLIRFHGGLDEIQEKKRLPIEVQVLFIGFGVILLGGMGVGFQMILTLDNQVTQFASILIFGGLPLLTISVILMNIRISVVSDSSSNLLRDIPTILQRASSVGVPLLFSGFLFFYPLIEFSSFINSNLNWWIFNDEIPPAWYFYIASGLISYKVLYSLWTHQSIPSDDLSGVAEDLFLVSFTAGAFFLLLSGLGFLPYYLLLSTGVPFVTAASPLSAIPYLWSAFVLLAMIYNEIDPDQE